MGLSQISDVDSSSGVVVDFVTSGSWPLSAGHRGRPERGAPTARAPALRHQAPAARDRERSLPGQEADAADRRFSVLPHGTTHDPGVRGHAVATKGLWVRGRLDGVRAEPVAVGLFRPPEGQRSLKRGPGLACRAAYSEFATSPARRRGCSAARVGAYRRAILLAMGNCILDYPSKGF